ncbi:MAG: 4Fe-4S binding protein [Deltaproteobacteria bacterium]|nr:4Fe-4S binding protein [Deltaproteobacteria bacterium]
MGLRLDRGLCRGCGACLAVCPGDLLAEGRDGFPLLAEPDRCWSCAACLKSCPHGALSLWLSPSLGGRGLELTATEETEGGVRRLRWRAWRGGLRAELVTGPGPGY